MKTPSFPIDIGGVKLEGGVVLGPMAGITNLTYRDFYKPFGVALSVSEMISDCGLAYGNQRTLDYLATSKKDRPVALQLFGSKIEETRKAIAIMEEHGDYDLLDINLGCPVHKVVKTGAGSALLRDTHYLYEYMSEVVKASHHPVTAKIRLGYDEAHINVRENAEALVKAGVKAIAVHARTKTQMYEGVADYTKIANLQNEIDVPLIISGDIFDVDSASKAMQITGASLVMVARGGVGNPFLITQLDKLTKAEEVPEHPGFQKQLEWAHAYCLEMVHDLGEKRAVAMLRGILPHFFKGYPGFRRIRNDIAQNLSSLDNIEALFVALGKRMKALP